MSAPGTPPFGLGPIGQVLIPVTDVERAAAWYREVLGIRYLFGFPGANRARHGHLDARCGDAR